MSDDCIVGRFGFHMSGELTWLEVFRETKRFWIEGEMRSLY